MEGDRLPDFTLTREELYALIWAAPLKTVAERFGISGPQLSKLCSAYNVARPDQGHWTRLELGKPVTVHPLQPPGSGLSDQIEIVSNPTRALKAASGQGDPGPASGKGPEVPDRLVRPHPLVAEWISLREKRQGQGKGL